MVNNKRRHGTNPSTGLPHGWFGRAIAATVLLAAICVASVALAALSLTFTTQAVPTATDYLPIRLLVCVVSVIAAVYTAALLVRYWTGPADESVLDRIRKDLL